MTLVFVGLILALIFLSFSVFTQNWTVFLCFVVGFVVVLFQQEGLYKSEFRRLVINDKRHYLEIVFKDKAAERYNFSSIKNISFKNVLGSKYGRAIITLSVEDKYNLLKVYTIETHSTKEAIAFIRHIKNYKNIDYADSVTKAKTENEDAFFVKYILIAIVVLVVVFVFLAVTR